MYKSFSDNGISLNDEILQPEICLSLQSLASSETVILQVYYWVESTAAQYNCNLLQLDSASTATYCS